jgi:hypothetical protein
VIQDSYSLLSFLASSLFRSRCVSRVFELMVFVASACHRAEFLRLQAVRTSRLFSPLRVHACCLGSVLSPCLPDQSGAAKCVPSSDFSLHCVVILWILSACPVAACAAFVVPIFSRAVRPGIGFPVHVLPTVVRVFDDLSARAFQASFSHGVPA